MSRLQTRWDTFSIPELDCPDEFRLIDKGLSQLDGVVALHPDYLRRSLLVEYQVELTDSAAIVSRLCDIGFPPKSVAQPPSALPRGRFTLAGAAALVIASLCWLFSVPSPWIAVLTVTATLLAGWPVLLAARRAIRLRQLDMNVLMAIAAAGALLVGEGFEAATTMVLFGVAVWLEHFSLHRARHAIETLVELTPETAHRLVAQDSAGGGSAGFEDIDTSRVQVGDHLLVKPGERIPVDAVVRHGSSSVNQAPITGESVPVRKTVEDEVFAGSLNERGALTIRASRTANNSSVARITRLVEQAQQDRSPSERMVDQFARGYTPAVVGLAAAVFLLPTFAALLSEAGLNAAVWEVARDWFHRGLVLLVIACPCALVISTPITIVCGLRRAAQLGAVVKGGEYLETLGRLKSVAFDKTGTLTQGVPVVSAIHALAADFDDDDILRFAAALERQSEHPLALAICQEAAQRCLELPAVSEFQSQTGVGVSGTIDGQHYSFGRQHLGTVQIDQLPTSATVVMLAKNNEPIGAIALADAIRKDAAAAIAQLRQLRIRQIVMLTGDREEVARRIAEPLKLDEVRAELLPNDKIDAIRQMIRGQAPLAMVGDGINDAPALAAASVGVAFGCEASDTALETADVALLSPRLERVAHLIRLGRATLARLKENISIAIGLKAIVFIIATLGLATMWMAVAADVGASLIVIANGMRLLRFTPDG